MTPLGTAPPPTLPIPVPAAPQPLRARPPCLFRLQDRPHAQPGRRRARALPPRPVRGQPQPRLHEPLVDAPAGHRGSQARAQADGRAPVAARPPRGEPRDARAQYDGAARVSALLSLLPLSHQRLLPLLPACRRTGSSCTSTCTATRRGTAATCSATTCRRTRRRAATPSLTSCRCACPEG